MEFAGGVGGRTRHNRADRGSAQRGREESRNFSGAFWGGSPRRSWVLQLPRRRLSGLQTCLLMSWSTASSSSITAQSSVRLRRYKQRDEGRYAYSRDLDARKLAVCFDSCFFPQPAGLRANGSSRLLIISRSGRRSWKESGISPSRRVRRPF